ncbi:MAG: ribulose-phosphate 3-epimerase [Clostridiales bacterium]|nr:ribulose-phosphate 3-epimerase [Clostridiales bacterium]
MAKLAPSILSADFSELALEVQRIEKGGADYIHVDVMDGHFVPNISYGATVMKSLSGKTKLPFDVHLMIEDPDKYIPEFVTDNTLYITVHQEAVHHLHRTLMYIKSLGVKAGVSINPSTPLSQLEEILPYVDLVLIMSVNPGFGGQKLISECLDTIYRLKEITDENDYPFLIEMDGGVTLGNLKQVIKAGADIVVAGSSIFHTEDREKTTKEFVKIIK